MTSTYDRLGDGGPLGSIAAIGAATIVLTFTEIEAVVGPLPPMARHVSWWGATPTEGHWYAHTEAWRRAGYRAAPDFAAETVTFHRVAGEG